MGAELRIESLYDHAWAIHGEAHRHATADRDHFLAEMSDRLGPDVAIEVQQHVDVALGHLRADDLTDLAPAAERAFHQLRALEMAVIEIEARIESECVFYDSYVGGLFPISFWADVIPLLDGGTSPGYMSKNVLKFLRMVKNADQRLPSGDGSEEMAEEFRERRRELIDFLERAIGLNEAVWCDA